MNRELQLAMRDVSFKVPEEFADVVDALASILDDVLDGNGVDIPKHIPELMEAFKGYQEVLDGMKGEYVNAARAYAALKLNLKKK